MTKIRRFPLILIFLFVLAYSCAICYGQPLDSAQIRELVAKPALYDSQYGGPAEPNETQVMAILNLDVYEYFDIDRRIDLQEKVYEQSEEYAAFKDSLIQIKKGFLYEWHYARLDLEHDYDIKRGLFVFHESENIGYEPIPPRSLGKYSFSSIPSIEEASLAGAMFGIQGAKIVQMVFYCDEKTALELENNRQDLDILVLFKIDGTYYKSYRFFATNGYVAGAWNDIKQELISTRDVNIAVVSKDRSRLFLTKNYTKK
jgi:hypothetical protein